MVVTMTWSVREVFDGSAVIEQVEGYIVPYKQGLRNIQVWLYVLPVGEGDSEAAYEKWQYTLASTTEKNGTKSPGWKKNFEEGRNMVQQLLAETTCSLAHTSSGKGAGIRFLMHIKDVECSCLMVVAGPTHAMAKIAIAYALQSHTTRAQRIAFLQDVQEKFPTETHTLCK